MPRANRHRPILLAAALSLALAGGAQAAGELGRGVSVSTFAGSYLAARSADLADDIGAAAAYYANALDADPEDIGLIEKVALLSVASGDFARALPLAERLVGYEPQNYIAGLALAIDAIKRQDWEAVESRLETVDANELGLLTVALLDSWVDFARGDVDGAVKAINELSGPDWFRIFQDYQAAILLDGAGRISEAVDAITRAHQSGEGDLGIVLEYARILARAGQSEKAIEALVALGGERPLHPMVGEMMDTIRAGRLPQPVATSVARGVAESLYGLGSSINPDRGLDLAAAYLQMALYVDPTAYAAMVSIGDLLKGSGQCEDAIAAYDLVPKSAGLKRNADIQIGHCLEELGKPEEAAATIAAVLERNPLDYEAAIELGNIYREDGRFAEAVDAYGRGIAAIDKPKASDWLIYYLRGMSLERSKRWDEAERDFLQALALEPKQPQVLNYLAYTWVDMGVHLVKAMGMLNEAVEAQPNNGAIVDSVGWAHYRLGRYDEAVDELERAVQMVPEDPIVNDHLGDAYWKVGRKREAFFQWTHARDLEPDETLLPLVLAKLENGPTEAAAEPAGPGDAKVPASIEVAAGDSLWTIAARVYGDAWLYRRIFEANRDSLSDPDLIYPGMTLDIPDPGAN